MTYCPGDPRTCQGQYHITFAVADSSGGVHSAVATVDTRGTFIGDVFVSPAFGNQFATGDPDPFSRPWMQPGFVPIVVAVFDEYGNQYYDGVKVQFRLSGPSGIGPPTYRTVQPFGLDPNYACDPAAFPDATYLPLSGDGDPAPPAEAGLDYRALTPPRPWPCELSHYPRPAYGAGLRLPFDPFAQANFRYFLAPEGAIYYVFPPASSSTPTLYTIDIAPVGINGGSCGGTLSRPLACPVVQVSFVDPQAAADKESGKAESIFLQLVDITTCGIGILGEPAGGLGTALTIYGCGRAFSGLVDITVLQHDAPDRHVKSLFLPRAARAPRLTATGVCRSRPRHITCAALLNAERAYVAALATVSTYEEASAVAIDRYGGGVQQGDAYHMIAQQAAAYVYLADLARASRQLARAGRTLAPLIRKSGEDIVLSAQQVQRVRDDLLQLKGIPRGLLAELRRDGVAPAAADAVAALRAAFAHAGPPHPLRLSTVLGDEPGLGGLMKQAQRLSPLHLQALVDTLAGQQLISRKTRRILLRAVTVMGNACTAHSRAKATRGFMSEVATHTRGQVRALLTQAAQQVMAFHRGVSAPLPKCQKMRQSAVSARPILAAASLR